jgi:hypothetical protein
MKFKQRVKNLGFFNETIQSNLLVLFIVFVLEACIIFNMAQQGVIGFYPIGYDQSQFLSKAYQLYEQSVGKNLWVSLFNELWEPTPSGNLIFPESVLSMHFFGPGRLACLAINCAHFFLAQFFIWFCIRKFTLSKAAAWGGVGIFLASSFTFFWAGGLFDFRLDFAGVCLYIVVLSLVIGSNFFLNTKILPWLILAITVLILTRFITAVYWFGITGLTMFWLVGTMGVGKLKIRSMLQLRNRLRFRNLLVISLIVCFFVLPFMFHNGQSIYNYYFIGHIFGPEKKIRALEAGITDILTSLTYYPISLWRDHLGVVPTLVIIASLLLILGYFLSRSRFQVDSSLTNQLFVRKLDGVGWFFIAISFFVPLFVLTVNTSKSPIVGAILVPSIIFALILFLYYLQSSFCLAKWYSLISGGLFVAGLAVFVNNATQPQAHALQYAYAKAINKLYGEIFRVVDVKGIERPKIAFIDFNEALLVQAFNVWVYEREGRFLDAQSTIGGIFALNSDEIKTDLGASDIIVIPDMVRSDVYPYYSSIRAEWGHIQNHLQEETKLLADIPLRDGYITHVYAKDNISATGLSGGWITSEGILFDVPLLPDIRGSKLFIKTEVPVYSGYGAVDQIPIARWIGPKGEEAVLKLHTYINGTLLDIYVDLPPHTDFTEGKVSLKFNKFFVPNERGINEDLRQLSANFISAKIISHNTNDTKRCLDVTLWQNPWCIVH